jgi:hypothetical protein
LGSRVSAYSRHGAHTAAATHAVSVLVQSRLLLGRRGQLSAPRTTSTSRSLTLRFLIVTTRPWIHRGRPDRMSECWGWIMVDGSAAAQQDCGSLPLQLCRGPSRQLSTCQQVGESNDGKQHTESDEHAAGQVQVEAFPQAVRGVLESTTLHHCEAARGHTGPAGAETELGELARPDETRQPDGRKPRAARTARRGFKSSVTRTNNGRLPCEGTVARTT